MPLKARDRTAISSGSLSASTRADRSPPATRSAACTSRAIGPEMALAAAMPSQTAPTSTSSAVSA
jgi:hypothetical protein